MIPQNESNATGSIKVFPSCWKNSHKVIFGAVFAVIARFLILKWSGRTNATAR